MKLMIEINDNEYMGIKEYPNNITSYPVTIHLYDAVRNGIPLEQEPKTGHWIENAPQYDMLNPQYICSECGNAHTRTTPYCEMCGAKMFEPQESEVNNG